MKNNKKTLTTETAEHTFNQPTNRLPLFDNIKFILIILVVVGHFADQITSDSRFAKSLFAFIYTFHMPLFIFISGLIHKRYNEHDRFNRKRVAGFILVYLALRLYMLMVRLLVSGTGSFVFVDGDGYWWFILCLAYYEGTVYLLRGLNHKPIMIMAVLASLVSGLDDSLTDFLALSRFVVFLPFFLAGYYLEPRNVVKTAEKKGMRIISACAIIFYTYICFFQTDFIYRFRGLFTGRNSFSKVAVASSSVLAGIGSRSFVMAVSAVMCLAVICVVPNKHIPKVTEAGRHTLQVYFWHRPLLWAMTYYDYCGLLTGGLGASLGKVIYILTGVLLGLILFLPIFAHPTDDLIRL